MSLSKPTPAQASSPAAELRILILEDDPIDLELIETTLKRGGIDGALVKVSDRQGFVEQLNTSVPDLILADFVLPSFDGALALELAQSVCPQVPFILVSGVMGEEQAIEALKQGATDYVLKQRLGRLVPSVRRALRESRERRERETVAKALRETDDLLGAIVDASPVGIITLTRQQRVMTWNSAAETLYGYPAEAVVDRPLDLTAAAQRETFDRCFTQALQNKTLLNQEFQHLKQDGTPIEVSLSLAPLHDADNAVYGVVMTVFDITVRKQIETQRLNLLKQESSARAAAESANRIKDEFLAVLSHELRTPLNAIVGWISLIQRGNLKPEVFQRAIDTIARNAAAQTQLIEDLLDLSRIVRGQVTLAIQPVNPVTLVQATAETLRPAAAAKSLVVALEADERVAPILADPNRLQQICWNLLSNAIKFTPAAGQVVVRVGASQNQLQIQVADSGIGIDPDFLPYVFDHFRQADGSSVRTQGGLGLGLAITRRLVELHGGTVQVHSAGLGQGSTFTVLIPMRLAPKAPPATPPAPDDGLSLRGVKAIVVDDEADARDLLTVILEQRGAEVESASTVYEAFQLLEHFHPDVIISDIGMPNEDGYSFLETVRSLPNTPLSQVPAIALTAYAREEDRHHARRVGFENHISKPFDPADVVHAVYQLTNAP
ncbi:response regulator [Nodosilinea nodulosa]|uniref:response regulator n=1 Tax=Nodosilinea nodulosa TaxID=416001 RepID=UPI000313608B|nr:response regulator [Nodosilinea nodulosa]